MGIVLEFVPSLLAALALALAFDFVFYVTGASVLKIISFGSYKSKICNYVEFKELKTKSNSSFFTQYLIGLSFYVAIVFAIVWFN